MESAFANLMAESAESKEPGSGHYWHSHYREEHEAWMHDGLGEFSFGDREMQSGSLNDCLINLLDSVLSCNSNVVWYRAEALDDEVTGRRDGFVGEAQLGRLWLVTGSEQEAIGKINSATEQVRADYLEYNASE
tara:strand:- start:272 stop:673 length:402 start_codon:yes stop_codon:yes gene_type:complete